MKKFPKSNSDLEWTLAIFFWISYSMFWFNTENMFISTNFTSIFLIDVQYRQENLDSQWFNPFEMLLQKKRICPIM